jgi:polyisoprenoid-binding protein YceI
MSVLESTKHFAPAGSWTADPVHSNVSFEVAYAGVGTFRGGFREFTAELDGTSLVGTAQVASVDVKDENLNGHLLSPDFFDARRYPEIVFRADDLISHEDGMVEGSGEITIKGVTRPVELGGRIGSPNVDPFGREKLGLSLETTVDRNEFGVSWNAPNQGGGDYLGAEVRLVADLVFVKKEA